jgi:protease-4
VKLGLVDTLARWSAVGTIMNKVLGHKAFGISSDRLLDDKIVSNNWGAKPRIAVVYAIGECAMDQGIKARWLEKKLLALAKDKSIKAIVFRADSPGGDGMASDLVAEAIKKCKQKKPVIVSQGQVAGSGGYWISMYGNEIIAGPSTITGSIGVIGGWLYNKSFTEKLGMTSDYVKRGDHADLGFGVSLPFTGLEVPARNLTEEEQARVKEIILTFYDDFVQKVAAGRDLPVDSVKKIAQGHFYSGLEGLSLGLVDEIGGMMTAIAVAKYKAGIKPEAEIELVEIPEYQGLIDLNPQRSLEITRIKNDPVYIYLKMVSERPGHPLPMLLPGTYPVLEEK